MKALKENMEKETFTKFRLEDIFVRMTLNSIKSTIGT